MKFALSLTLLILTCLADAYELRFVTPVKTDAHRISDVVNIKNADKSWLDLELDGSLTRGDILKAQDMIDWLIRKTGNHDWQWRGIRTIKVIEDIKSTSDELKTFATLALKEKLKHYDGVELEILGTPKSATESIKSFHPEISLRQPVQSRVCVWLMGLHTKRAVWFKVKAFKRVLITKKVLHKGDRIKPSDVELKKTAIQGLKHMPINTLEKPIRVIHDIPKAHWLTVKDIEKIPDITNGDLVDVTFISKKILFKLTAIAKSDANKGEDVLLENPHSHQTFKAHVTGLKQAELKV